MYKEIIICIIIIILIFIFDFITKSSTEKTINQMCRGTRRFKVFIRKRKRRRII